MGPLHRQSDLAGDGLSRIGKEVRVLALVPGAYGADGGIAQYNRDLFLAMIATPVVREVVVLPRLANPTVNDQMPPGVSQLPAPANKLAFATTLLSVSRSESGFEIVFCGHINLLPLAALVAERLRAKLWLQAHGIEAWSTPSYINRRAASMVDLLTSVSRFTRTRMIGAWWWSDPNVIKVLPNTVQAEFAPGPKSAVLVERHQLQGRRVLLTVSRLAATEAYKGHDRVIAALAQIRQVIPNLVYLIVGDGDDLVRLQRLAKVHGQENHVIFAGRAPASELVDHYRTADLFIMPSTGEGFGIAFLEAAACGLPVIGGANDGSWDALREGRVGVAIDPTNEDEIVQSVIDALENSGRGTGKSTNRFRVESFQAQVSALVENLVDSSERASSDDGTQAHH